VPETVSGREAGSTAPPSDQALAFEALDLPSEVREGIRNAGFLHCTPIQERVLPLALSGKDVAGQAQTGTGKTAAFLITLFTRLLRNRVESRSGAPRALVIAPTRELVVQIAADAALLGSGTGFHVHAVYGGVDYKKQRDTLSGDVDLLIGTPGRLIDYWKQHVYDLRRVEALVIDEADRMFDMGFIQDLRFLLRRLPHYDRRQSMLFSATLSWAVMELGYEFMNEPVRVMVAPEQVTAENVEHVLYHVGKHEKLALLVGLLRREADERVLIFCNMKRTAERLETNLGVNGFQAAAITGDVDQRRRLKLLEDFREGRLPILIATDVASRGLHIEAVTHVVNYDLPQDAEDYVHRIGRTARAGASGKALSLACEDFVESLEPIERYVGFKIPHVIPDEEMFADVKHAAERRWRPSGRPQGRGSGPRGGSRRR
jgi:ATP-dependent RNA helicase RhlB